MEKNASRWLIGAIMLAATAGVLVLVFGRGEVPSSNVDVSGIVPTSTMPSVDDLSLNTDSISNISEARKVLRQMADASYSYKINWVNISEVDVDGDKMYFGELDKVSGDGTQDKHPMPLFLVKGTLYTPNGYGGNTYDMKETNWVDRYKNLDITDFLPLELRNSPVISGSLQVFNAATGIDKISLSLDRDGKATKIEIKMKGKEAKVFEGPFVYARLINLLTVDDYKDFPDYNAYQERYRKLPGNVTQESTYEFSTGYTITYPSLINGMKVTVLHDSGQYSDSFYIDDQPYDPDAAHIYCYQNNQQQIGPQKGLPEAISMGSRSKLADWGVTQEYHQDVLSFTGPGYYCQFRTSGIFRQNMFEISF